MRSSTEKTETRNLREREHEQRGVTLKKCGPEPASRNPLGGERLRKPPDAVRSGVAKTSYSSRALGLGERSAMPLGGGRGEQFEQICTGRGRRGFGKRRGIRLIARSGALRLFSFYKGRWPEAGGPLPVGRERSATLEWSALADKLVSIPLLFSSVT